MWCTWQLVVPASGATSADQLPPGSNDPRRTAAAPALASTTCPCPAKGRLSPSASTLLIMMSAIVLPPTGELPAAGRARQGPTFPPWAGSGQDAGRRALPARASARRAGVRDRRLPQVVGMSRRGRALRGELPARRRSHPYAHLT